MTPEQKAREWAEKINEQYHADHKSDHNDRLNDAVKSYLTGHRESFTTLLDELPEPVDMQCSTKAAQIAYREKIKSLIQNKLK